MATECNASVAASDFAESDITITLPGALDPCLTTGAAWYYDNGLEPHEYSAADYEAGTFIDDVEFEFNLSDLADSKYADDYTITITATGTARIAKAGATHTGKATCVETTQTIVVTFVVAADGSISVDSTNQGYVNDYDLTSNVLSFSLKVSVGPLADHSASGTPAANEEAGDHGVIHVAVANA